MNYVFFDKSNKLRSGWRATIFLFAFILFAALFRAAQEIAFSASDMGGYSAKMLFFTVNSLFLLILAVFFGWLAGKLFENLPFRTIGAAFTGGWLKRLLLGALIGVATLCFAVLIAVVFGGERFEINLTNGTVPILYSLSISFIVFAAGAAWEEALFRGYILQTFARSGFALLAIFLTSVFFGIVHLANANATILSTANTILAGLWFSVAYIKTRDLWLVWGVHLMWNWMQGSFFGIEVSGLTDITASPLFKEIDTGPTWLTGQSYGIEGGIACTFALILSMVLIYFLPNPKPDAEMLALSSPPTDN